MLAAVHVVERACPGAAAALFQVDPDAHVVSMRAAGPRWRTVEREAPAWVTREMAGFVRGAGTCDGCWWRGPGSGEQGGYGIARVRVVAANRLWGVLVVVGDAQETGRDTGFVEGLAAEVGLALSNAAARAALERVHGPCRQGATATFHATQLVALVLGSLDGARPHLGDANERHDRNIRIRVRCEDDPSVRVEHDSMRDALVHILTHAIDASIPAGNDIEVCVGREGQEAFVAVIDYGVGMDEQTRQRVSAPSFAIVPQGGAGHGVAACRAVVERHGGRLAVASTRGVGSTVTVWLPTASATGLN